MHAAGHKELFLQSAHPQQQASITHLSQLFGPCVQVVLCDTILLPHLSAVSHTMVNACQHHTSLLSTITSALHMLTPYFFHTCQQLPTHMLTPYFFHTCQQLPTQFMSTPYFSPVNNHQCTSYVNTILLPHLSAVINTFHLSMTHIFHIYQCHQHASADTCSTHANNMHLSTPYICQHHTCSSYVTECQQHISADIIRISHLSTTYTSQHYKCSTLVNSIHLSTLHMFNTHLSAL